jgi:hypothetical protein
VPVAVLSGLDCTGDSEYRQGLHLNRHPGTTIDAVLVLLIAPPVIRLYGAPASRLVTALLFDVTAHQAKFVIAPGEHNQPTRNLDDFATGFNNAHSDAKQPFIQRTGVPQSG